MNTTNVLGKKLTRGDRGWEPGRLGGGRLERKGWEVGVLRGQEAGEKCEMLIILI